MQPISEGKTSQSTRRTFMKTTGAVAAGIYAARPSTARGSEETLAIAGGTPAVTYPKDKHAQASRWPLYGPEEEEAVLALIRSPSYGPLDALEKDWRDYFDVPFAKSHCNGTSALTSMFFALDLPPGSEILVPSYTFFATIVPMRLFGLVPVFVDINPRSLDFDLEDAKKRLTKDTKAVLPVHWFGNPADMDHICDWADEKGLIVLEDAAHGHGSKLKDKYMGKWGRMAIYSFQCSKPLPAVEGGMGVYQNEDDHARATAFGHYKIPGVRGGNPYSGYSGTGLAVKFRMHPFAAALARCQLKKLAKRNSEGTAQVRQLNDQLCDLPGLYDQATRPEAERLYYDANVLFIDPAEAGMSREKCIKALQAEGVRAWPFVYLLQHTCKLYGEPQWWHHPPVIPSDLRGSEQANATSIALPYFTSQVPELVDQYVKAFQKVWAHRGELT